MNKAELVAALAAKTGDTKKASEAAVNAFVDVVRDALKKGASCCWLILFSNKIL